LHPAMSLPMMKCVQPAATLQDQQRTDKHGTYASGEDRSLEPLVIGISAESPEGLHQSSI